jgi:hypothetical protein
MSSFMNQLLSPVVLVLGNPMVLSQRRYFPSGIMTLPNESLIYVEFYGFSSACLNLMLQHRGNCLFGQRLVLFILKIGIGKKSSSSIKMIPIDQ